MTAITLTDSNFTISSPSLTINPANVGTPDPNRQVLLGVTATGGGSITGVTVNGVSATQQANSGLGNGTTAAIYTIPLATGTTANIVATFSASVAFGSLGVFNLQNSTVGTVSSGSVNQTASAAISLSTVAIPSGGAALFVVSSSGVNGINWTNAASQYDLTFLANGEGSAGTNVTPGTPTVTATNASGTSDLGIVGAAFSSLLAASVSGGFGITSANVTSLVMPKAY